MSEKPAFLPDNLGQSSVPTPSGPPHRLPAEAAEEVRVLPIIEERATIRREVVETGRVVLTRRVHETDETISVPVQHDEVEVEHVLLNQTLPAGAPTPAIRYEGDTMIIPVLREVAVVERRLLLVEELRVTKRQLTTQHTEPVHLRREEINVERVPAVPVPPSPTT